MGFGERDYVKEKARQERAEELKRRSHNSRPSENWNAPTSPNAAKWIWIRILWWALVFGGVYWYKHHNLDSVGRGTGGETPIGAAMPNKSFYGIADVVSDGVIPKKIAAIPRKTGYTDLNKQVVMNGNASFTIANKTGNTILGRLVYMVGRKQIRVREFYTLNNDSIALNRLDSGYYILKYKLIENDINHITEPMKIGLVGNYVYTGSSLVVTSKLDGDAKISDSEFDEN